MKSLLLTLLLVSASTFALASSEGEHGVEAAILKQIDKPQPQTVIYKLTKNVQDVDAKVSSFTFRTNRILSCPTPNCPGSLSYTQFEVTDQTKDACGTTIYTAQEKTQHSEAQILKVEDHTTRTCRDFKPYRWEVTVWGFRFEHKYVGNPGPVKQIR